MGGEVCVSSVWLTAADPHVSGFTPLHIAVAQRNWGTAKLIIAIAMAQYKPAEPQLMTMTRTIAARTVQIGNFMHFYLSFGTDRNS